MKTLETSTRFGDVKRYIAVYGAFSVVVLAGVAILSIIGREVTSFMWGRAGGMLASAVVAYWLTGLAAKGSRGAYIRIRIISVVVPLAVVVIDGLGADVLPLWFVVLQIAGAVALAPTAFIVNRRSIRSAFARRELSVGVASVWEMTTDWNAWHAQYDDPSSGLSQRLRFIQGLIGEWLDRTAPNDVRIVSACAGDGRDLLQVLRNRSDSDRVSATLLEYDEANAARARSAAADFPAIEVRQVDAGRASSYEGAIPADLVLMAGVFGKITDEDVRGTIEALPGLCKPGALVIWTRHREAPDLTPAIRDWFAAAGFTEQSFFAPGNLSVGAGSHRFTGTPTPWDPDGALFTFTH